MAQMTLNILIHNKMQTRDRVNPRSEFKIEASLAEIKGDLKKLAPKTDAPAARRKEIPRHATEPRRWTVTAQLEEEALEGISQLLGEGNPKMSISPACPPKANRQLDQFPMCFYPYSFMMMQNHSYLQQALAFKQGSPYSTSKNSALHVTLGYKISQLKQSYLSYPMY